jgi:hypothetical protein
MRDPSGSELVRTAARAATLRAALALLAATTALAGCGGGESAGGGRVAWNGTPVLRASPTGARIVTGALENHSSSELRVAVPEVKLLDARGRAIKSTAVFAAGFVRSMFPHNGVVPTSPAKYPEAEQRRVGYLSVLGPGKTTPLTVSWLERPGRPPARRILVGSASLPVPGAPVSGGDAPAR